MASRRYILGHPNLLLPWAAEKMPWPGFSFAAMANTIGVVVDGNLACVAVYHDYFPQYKTISMSISATDARWATRESFGVLLGFPFNGLGCESITTWQPADHARALKLVKGVGFQEVGILRKKFNGQDIRILDLLKGEAERWLKYCPMGLYGGGGTDGQAESTART